MSSRRWEYKFCKNLVSIRKDKGRTQNDLAIAAGVGRNMICFYERGDVSPTIRAVCAIAEALNVSPAEFFKDGD